MKPSLDRLFRIIKLESDRAYDNRAVMGGLERMLDSWVPEARADALPEDLIQTIINRFRDYPRLGKASRVEVLEGLWRRIQRASEEPLPALNLRPAPPHQQDEASSVATAPGVGEQPAEEKPGVEKEPISRPEEETSTTEGRTEPRREVRAPWPLIPSHPPAALNAPVSVLPGVGNVLTKILDKLGIHTLGEVMYYLPRRYDDYSKLKPINRLWYGEEVTVVGTVQTLSSHKWRSGKGQIIEAVISDGTGALRVTWFNPKITRLLRAGAQISLSGKIDQYLGRLVMNNPEWEAVEQQQLNTNRIVPVYRLTAGITQRRIRRIMNQVVTYWAPRIRDHFPTNIRRTAGLVDLQRALLQVHFPDTADDLKAAQQRLAFDEIFLLQLGVLGQKRDWQNHTARIFETDDAWLLGQVERLPFPLTGAQQRALEDMRHDLASGRPMNRLLQGDVGSGKTVIAALGIAMVTRHGAQAAIMAPTSILADQHFKNLVKLLIHQGAEAEGIGEGEIRLMIGSTPEAEKREIRAGLLDGSIKVVVGTHALIEEPVVFKELQLIIVDEQHRFGVEQRAALRSKGDNPHLLVMTATPIPRSLALTIYGDLDLSVMDEMPPGRQPVSTFVLAPRERERAYTLIRSQVEQGQQVFIIYPLVEESDKSEAKAAVEEHTRLQQEVFPKLKLGLLHGRLPPEEKDDVMTHFRDGEFQILVSTSVVEVGVDVPNATVMLIEGANHFGLAQLHQFRGRVGRGSEKAYCLLIPETPDAVENERLQVMAETNDGFVLAERDLEQRGPGQFLGTRQSGYSELRLANLSDVHLIEKARRQAQALFEQDPELSQPENQLLVQAVERFWGGSKGDVS